MKRTQIMVACALVLALAGATTVQSAEEGVKQGKATVRSVHGTVQYFDNGDWLPVKPNMKFDAGIAIRTGTDGMADLSINGLSSAVRITNNTTLQIPTMTYAGSAQEGDTTTMLNLRTGMVIGNVKKITANSRYEIMTPHGVAGIRGTDWAASANPLPDGTFEVTFSSITGTITVSAVIAGHTVTHTLTTGMSWVIGQDPKQMSPETVEFLLLQIRDLIQDIFHPTAPEPGRPHFPPPPFPAGPPTGQPPS